MILCWLITTYTITTAALANYFIDEGCCERFITEPNCLESCFGTIEDESITTFSPSLFPCVNPRVQQKVLRCILRSNYGLPIGRDVCCARAVETGCRDACLLFTPVDDFNNKCKPDTEVSLFSCVSEYLHLKECCYSSPVNLTCAAACNQALDYGPTLKDWVDVRLNCDQPFPEVKQCMTRYSGHSNSSRYACCNLSSREQCRYVCDKGMRGDHPQTDLLEALFDACGDPIQDDTWLCLMSDGQAAISPLGELTAIQCCRKAFSITCRNLCLNLYKNWLSTELWEQFSRTCRYAPREEDMTNCILDVSEPCTLGCDHLTFCSNLNNRPLDLFRTCSSKYDEGAELDYKMWAQQGTIETPLVNITVLNITSCKPHIWKGIACVLQTKPCHPASHSNSICHNVCVELLTSCLDHSRSHRSVEDICGILSPYSDPDHCVNLENYLVPGIPDEYGTITHPCQPSPCSNSQQCVLNRNCVSGDSSCIPYSCLDSCSIGALRDYQVELGSWVRIPVVEDSDCYKVCTCDDEKKLSSCQDLQCPGSTDCRIGEDYYSHMSQFELDCNSCVCYSGLVTCTKRQCSADGAPLPGGCAPYYSPVCGSNGASYPNPCVARQFSLKDSLLHYQPCSSVDVCVNSKCPSAQVCRPRRQTCLDLRLNCPQYDCESPTINCEGEDVEPVCDTENVQHPHMCSLSQQNRKLWHTGYCLGSCNTTAGQVCGANGRNYGSSCTAESEYMIVDYPGPCKPPSDQEFAKGLFCSGGVRCPSLPKICEGNTITGMCCPVCAPVVSLLPSQVLVAINEMYLTNDKFTVSMMCRRLNNLLSLSECMVQCNVGLFGDITSIVRSTLPQPSWLQIEACNKEAIRFVAMIKNRHVRIQTDLVLSTILGARVRPVNITGSRGSSAGSLQTDFTFICNLLFIVTSLVHGVR